MTTAAEKAPSISVPEAVIEVTAVFLVYNLPGRDCAAGASNGELKWPLFQCEKWHR